MRRACSIPILLAACSGASAPTVPATDAYPSPASGSRLRAQYLQAEDGTRIFAAWFDSARDEACRFALADDGEFRCLPARAGAVDCTCVEPAVTYRQGAVCQPRYAADSSGRGVYQLDPTALPGMVTVGTCSLGGPDQVTYRAKRVLPGEFVRARRARRSRASRPAAGPLRPGGRRRHGRAPRLLRRQSLPRLRPGHRRRRPAPLPAAGRSPPARRRLQRRRLLAGGRRAGWSQLSRPR